MKIISQLFIFCFILSCNSNYQNQSSNLDSIKKIDIQIKNSSSAQNSNSKDSFLIRKNFVEIYNKKFISYSNKKNLDTIEYLSLNIGKYDQQIFKIISSLKKLKYLELPLSTDYCSGLDKIKQIKTLVALYPNSSYFKDISKLDNLDTLSIECLNAKIISFENNSLNHLKCLKFNLVSADTLQMGDNDFKNVSFLSLIKSNFRYISSNIKNLKSLNKLELAFYSGTYLPKEVEELNKLDTLVLWHTPFIENLNKLKFLKCINLIGYFNDKELAKIKNNFSSCKIIRKNNE